MGKREELIARLDAVRAQVVADLTDAPDARLGDKPEGVQRALRNQLLRFAEHQRQHVNQIEKTRWAIGARPSEVHMILGQAEEELGRMRAALVGLSDEQLAQRPSPDAWSIAEIVEHVANVEVRYAETAKRILNT